jgi:hypothetical protein
MKRRHWFALTAIVAACLISLGAVHSAGVQVAIAPDAILDKNVGKGKGPKCTREVFCDPLCEIKVCNGNSCECECIPVPCAPTD